MRMAALLAIKRSMNLWLTENLFVFLRGDRPNALQWELGLQIVVEALVVRKELIQ